MTGWFCHVHGSQRNDNLGIISLEVYGAKVDQLKAEIGGTVKQSDIEAALKQKKYKLITVTHVDTSTGPLFRDLCVLHVIDIHVSCPFRYQSRRRAGSERVTGDTGAWYPLLVDYDSIQLLQVVVDAVCSVASEEIQMDAWGIDVVLTASQKGLGAPPGLSIVVVSRKALKVRQSPISFFASNSHPVQVFEDRSTAVTSYYASWKK